MSEVLLYSTREPRHLATPETAQVRALLYVQMANPKHVTALLADVDQWNQTRSDDPTLRPDLTGADLNAANLTMADLRHAQLHGADLSMTDLEGADLRWADLSATNMVGARLIGADLEGANLSGADLRTAEDLTTEQLEDTIGDDRTRLPDHVSRPQRWAQTVKP
jgi:hypothetical protein